MPVQLEDRASTNLVPDSTFLPPIERPQGLVMKFGVRHDTSPIRQSHDAAQGLLRTAADSFCSVLRSQVWAEYSSS